MVTVRIYTEGGGDSAGQKAEFRQGLSNFLAKAGLKGKMPRIIACGGRSFAFRDFCTAIRTHSQDVSLLLVDSEDPLPAPLKSKWEFLYKRDGWNKPDTADETQVYLMVQAMEAWLLADPDQLRAYYGAHFNENALPPKQNALELLTKRTMNDALAKATKDTPKKSYSKGANSFHLMGLIDPGKVLIACPYAKEFIDYLIAIS